MTDRKKKKPTNPHSAPGARPKTALVVGGGLMGTSAALELRRRGLEVTVLEKALPGAEASSAAAGILGAEVENTGPGPMLELSRKSRALYAGWVASLEKESGVSVGFEGGGSLEAFLEPKELASWKKARRAQIAAGDAVVLSAAALRALEPGLSKELVGALHFPADARITPPALFRAAHIAAHKRGVRFVTGALVRHVDVVTLADGTRSARGVVLEDGSRLDADVTIVAAGSWTPLVGGLPIARGDVVPARGQIVELVMPVPVLSRLVFGAGVYLIPRADGHVLVGSTLEFVGFNKAVTAKGVRDLLTGALRLVPALAEAEVGRTWSNFRPYTPDTLPLLGSAGIGGLVIASGHHRNGILLAPITAKVVESLVFGERPPLDLAAFDPLRPALGASRQK